MATKTKVQPKKSKPEAKPEDVKVEKFTSSQRVKLTDEEIVAMTQQYTQTHDGKYVTHLAYEEINRQGAAGRQRAKCPNCGNPYPLDKPGATPDICSSECALDYLTYLNQEMGL